MNAVLHKSNTRGHANFGWLDSHHTFSFGQYYNPDRVHFGALRVLNDDIVDGGAGFGKHPHDNMEIVSIPLSGDLKHEDSTGRGEIIKSGDVQIMSAGSGIQHSEFNPNRNEKVNFLQIWVLPKERNITPRYDQKTFSALDRVNKIQTVVAPDDPNAIWINQDAYFSLSVLEAGKDIHYMVKKPDHGVYLFVIDGEVQCDDIVLNKRDGVGITDTNQINLHANDKSEILFIEVPMIKVSF